MCANQSQAKETAKDEKKACRLRAGFLRFVEEGAVRFFIQVRPSRKWPAKSGARLPNPKFRDGGCGPALKRLDHRPGKLANKLRLPNIADIRKCRRAITKIHTPQGTAMPSCNREIMRDEPSQRSNLCTVRYDFATRHLRMRRLRPRSSYKPSHITFRATSMKREK